jgi:hypothetical protein
MTRIKSLVVVVLLLGFALPVFAEETAVDSQDALKKYFNELAIKVKNLDDPAAKRELLDEALVRLLDATDRMERRAIGSRSKESVAIFRQEVQEKHDELNGLEGYARVADADLDSFADYMVQDLEQARSYVVMSTGLAIVLLIILLILIF